MTGPTYHEGAVNGTNKSSHGVEYEVTASASDASIAEEATISLSGALADVLVVFDGTIPPNSLSVKIEDSLGGEVMAATVFTATGYAQPTNVQVFLPGPLNIVCTGNSTNSAKAKIILILI